jgi:hypothetical protein
MDDERKAVQLQEIPPQYAPRYAVIDAALRAGMQQSDIAAGLRVNRSTITHAKQSLQRKYDLTTQKYVKLAANAIKQTLAGKPIGDSDAPKASTIITAAQMVYDRAQPIKTVDTVNNTNTFVQFNLGAASAPDVVNIPDLIDITPPDTTP